MFAPDSREYKTGFHTLRQLCAQNEYLPASFNLSNEKLKITSDHPEAFGTFGDVWRGTYTDEEIAVKAVRMASKSDLRTVMKVQRLQHSLSI